MFTTFIGRKSENIFCPRSQSYLSDLQRLNQYKRFICKNPKPSSPEKMVHIRGEYCESSIETVATFHQDETIDRVLEGVEEELIRSMQRHWRVLPNIELDRRLTRVYPEQSTSSNLTAKDLLPRTVIKFWPNNDNLPLGEHASKTLANQLAAEEKLEDAKKDRGELSKRIDNLGEILEGFEKKFFENEKEKGRAEERFRKVKKGLAETRERLAKTEHRLALMIDNTQWIWFRFLLDSVRAKVAEHMHVRHWHEIHPSDRVTSSVAALNALRMSHKMRDKFQLTSREISLYLASEWTKAKKQGNYFAHTGEGAPFAEGQ